MSTILEAVNIKRFFGRNNSIQALKGVNLSVERNRLVALKGRSGSGKTTLLNILGALDSPSEGQVLFEEQDLTKMSERQKVLCRRKKMGFIFQSFALVPLMTAKENVEFGMRVAGFPMSQQSARADEVLDMVGLKKRASHYPYELSGGEQQRCAIARAIAHKPSLILADEPTAELDSRMGMQVMKVFMDLVQEHNITIVMTTHDPSIMEVVDTLYELDDGVIVDQKEGIMG
jgi:putative ABC transport system ATP-binding protein